MSANIDLYTIGSGMALLGLFFTLAIWAITAPYYDNVLGFKKYNNPAANGNSDFIRALQYAILIVFKRGMKKSYDRKIFGDIDFREKARPIDKFLCFSMVIFFWGGCVINAFAFVVGIF